MNHALKINTAVTYILGDGIRQSLPRQHGRRLAGGQHRQEDAGLRRVLGTGRPACEKPKIGRPNRYTTDVKHDVPVMLNEPSRPTGKLHGHMRTVMSDVLTLD